MNKFLIYRFLIGIKKKNLFNVKYVSVYLMLNAMSMNFIDYKSIALPAELQGHLLFLIIYLILINIFFCFVYMKKNYRCTIRYI